VKSIKIQPTKKRFYNKWLYKVSICAGPGAVFYRSRIYLYSKYSGNTVLRNIINFLDSKSKDIYAVRVEHHKLDIYTNDSILFDEMLTQFKDEIRLAYAPDENSIDLLNGRQIIAKKYPHDRYQYKVFLTPYRLNSIDEKARWIKWLSTQGDKVKITESVKTWFCVTNYNWDRRYMYVDNESTLLMLKMRDPNALGAVYSYTIVDK
jgi:hypothetical protein